ncbi:RHS repeat domain-containing protein [Robiginitomaculum antarcticum]|uniref:RHS repeat domain-containing protein n=1 Tax=Robiginitomaculum antarcticum TaxID=437507 RepID=UPI0003730B24|nr:RHS repeat-associated core domain-containing protein [Robiginitomaculum antarcticum]
MAFIKPIILTILTLFISTGPWGSAAYGYDGRLPTPFPVQIDSQDRFVSTADLVQSLKRVKSVMNGVAIYNIYDSSGLVSMVDPLTGNDQFTYLRLGGNVSAKIHRQPSDLTAPVIEYTHTDHLGSPVAGTDSAGNVAWRERYTPYGEKLLNPTALDNQAAFTGHIYDAPTGLTYMQARYYDPNIGRFLSIDPVGVTPSTPGMFNRYSYVGNDPINAIDPDGRQVCSSCRFMRPRPRDEKLQENVQKASVKAGSVAGAVGGTVADFTPGVGDAKGAIEFSENPTLVGGAAVVVGVVPIVGDLAGKGLKAVARHSSEKRALTAMAKMDKKTGGITEGDMSAYKQLNSELPDPYPTNTVRGPESHPTASAPTSQQPHGHVGPVDHIPIKPEKP